MKRVTSLLLILTLITVLSACDDNSEPSKVTVKQEVNGDGANDKNEEQNEEQNRNSEEEANTDVDIDITEKMYVAWINEIYTNTDDYLGKTVHISGLYSKSEGDAVTYHYVTRQGPGCCGNDGAMCGLEMLDIGCEPADGDWVDVVGTLSTYPENGVDYIALKDVTCKIDNENRGSEIVQN